MTRRATPAAAATLFVFFLAVETKDVKLGRVMVRFSTAVRIRPTAFPRFTTFFRLGRLFISASLVFRVVMTQRQRGQFLG